MKRREHRNRRLAVLAGVGLMAVGALAGCGKQGSLDRPGPLFGSRARAEYEAEQAQNARDEAQRAAQRGDAQLPPGDPPPSTREIRDPNQRLAPASSAPLPGAPNPFGGPTSATPR